MPVYTPAYVDVILPLIINKLVNDGVFLATTCYMADDDDLYAAPGNQYALLVPGRGTMLERSEIGGGRQVTIMDQELILAIWNRYGVERAGSRPFIFTDPTGGVYPLADKAVNSLSEHFPQDASLNVYSMEGIRFMHWDRPERKKTSEEWIRLRLHFRLVHQLPLTYVSPPT